MANYENISLSYTKTLIRQYSYYFINLYKDDIRFTAQKRTQINNKEFDDLYLKNHLYDLKNYAYLSYLADQEGILLEV